MLFPVIIASHMKTDNARTLKIDIRALGYDSGTRNRKSGENPAFEGRPFGPGIRFDRMAIRAHLVAGRL